jgi:hypothetical protein
MKNAIFFWDVAPCRSCVNRRFGGSYRLHPPARAGSSLADFSILSLQPLAHAGSSLVDFSTLNLQPPAHAGSSLVDFSTLKMEAIRSSETSVHTRCTRRHISEYGILHLKIRLIPDTWQTVSYTPYVELVTAHNCAQLVPSILLACAGCVWRRCPFHKCNAYLLPAIN